MIDGAIERFGISRLADQQSRELSSGQRTLVSIVKSTLHEPKLLVLDEPTASLDPDVAGRVRSALLDTHRVMHRHWIVLLRAPQRFFEISFWPVIDVLLWGSLGAYVARQSPKLARDDADLLAGIVMFWTFTQAEFSIALGVNEETWTRNILNVLATPVTEFEYIVGIALFGLLKLALCLLTLTITTLAIARRVLAAFLRLTR